MARSSRRGPWLPEEDGVLLSLVRSQGPNNWVRISQHMLHRSPKQCRERYHQNLKPSLNHEPITPEEGEAIERLVQEMGKRWAEIARRLGNRSDNAVKNWWNGSMNRRRRTTPQSSRGMGFRYPALSESDQYSAPLQRLPFSPMEPSRQTPGQYHAYHGTEQGQSYFDGVPAASLHTIAIEGRDERQPFTQHVFAPTEGSQAMSPHYPQLLTPASMQPSPSPFYQPTQYAQQAAMQSALPHFSRAHSNRDWPYTRPDEPMISPAPHSGSQAYSMPHPPSLVSDNRSSSSISPKTVPSPKPASPAAIGLSYHWHDTEKHREIPAINYVTREEQLPALRLPQVTLDPALRRPLSAPTTSENRVERIEIPSPRSDHYDTGATPPAERDARMNVSNLLD